MPPDNYRILPVLIEGLNLPSWNASQSWESAGRIFSYPCKNKRAIDAQFANRHTSSWVPLLHLTSRFYVLKTACSAWRRARAHPQIVMVVASRLGRAQ